jgi:hypothetical protein
MLEQSPAGELCDAVIMAGTHLCCRHLVQDIVHCVGGIGVFFPLLTQLDQPVAEALAFMGVTGERRYVQGCPVESHVVVEVIELVTGVLAGNFANQQYMHNIAGMAVLGFLLQSVLPQNLTIKVVSALEGLLTTVAKANGKNFLKLLSTVYRILGFFQSVSSICIELLSQTKSSRHIL